MIALIAFVPFCIFILYKLVQPKIQDKREPCVYKLEERRGWGNAICLDTRNPSKLKAHGWISSPRITKGDILTYTSQSNHEIKLKFTKVDYCRDPHDMFFAELKLID